MAAPSAISRLPEEPGVYRFRDGAGRALYVGRAVRLRRRVRSYWGDLGDRRHLRRMVPRVARIEAVVCASAHEASWLERNLLQESRPPWNRVVGGAEVPLMIILDRDPPRLRILHETGVCPTGPAPREELTFGPFLGGMKVRLLAAAVQRIYPIAYARDRLSGAERDLGRILGVTTVDREPMISSVLAILGREPDAVAGFLARLEDRRDAATSQHCYEISAAIQSELAAATWLLAPQRVATGSAAATTEHQDLYGWHDGVLVRFRLQDGRLRGWRIRDCDADRGRPLADTTPQAWQSFADQNARLAAALRT